MILKYKPAVEKSWLLLLSAAMWICVGTMLLVFSITWLQQVARPLSYLYSVPAVILALIIHHFGFLRVVDKNLARILPMQGKPCMFAFISWKSYLLVAVMASTGIILRHSPIPKPYLSILYLAIGLALILSSIRYLRFLLYHCS